MADNELKIQKTGTQKTSGKNEQEIKPKNKEDSLSEAIWTQFKNGAGKQNSANTIFDLPSGDNDSVSSVDTNKISGVFSEKTNEDLFKKSVGEIQKNLSSQYDKALEDFNIQLKYDGWSGDVADGFSKIWNNKLYGNEHGNTADLVREDLAQFKSNLEELEKASKQGGRAYKRKFKEIFGVDYKSKNITRYNKASDIYSNILPLKTIQDDFKIKFAYLLQNDKPSEEYSQMQINPYPPTGDFGFPSIPYVTATKTDVYNREYKNLTNYIGEQGKAQLDELIKSKNPKTIEEKYKILHDFTQTFSESITKNIKDISGGRDFETVQNIYKTSYKMAFGNKNNIIERINDYNISQQRGSGAVKSVATISAMAAMSFATMGMGTLVAEGAAIATAAGATALTEVSDRFTSKAALDELKTKGLMAYLEKGSEITDWSGVAKASAVSGGMTLVFMGQSYAVSNLCKVAGMSATSAAVANSAAFIGTGLGSEYLISGEITVEGATFTVLLAVVGGALQIKHVHKAETLNATQKEAKLATDIQNARKTLGFDNDTPITPDQLKLRYRELAAKYHPDKGGSAIEMATINSARELLKNNIQRINDFLGKTAKMSSETIKSEAHKSQKEISSKALMKTSVEQGAKEMSTMPPPVKSQNLSALEQPGNIPETYSFEPKHIHDGIVEICKTDTQIKIVPDLEPITLKQGGSIIRDKNNNIIEIEGVINDKHVYYEYNWDSENQLVSIKDNKSDGSYSIQYYQDQSSPLNIKKCAKISIGKNTTVEYDANSRPVHIFSLNNRYTANIIYDKNGNVTSFFEYDKSKNNKIFLKRNEKGKLINMFDEHAKFYKKNMELLSSVYGTLEHDCWRSFYSSSYELTAWKIHLYSVEETDWQKMASVVIPYLKKNGIHFKTLSKKDPVEVLGFISPLQKGKAFTIYPHSNEEMEAVAKGLDELIKNNNLTIKDSRILGDRQMGDSGRLFYRYEYKSGKYSDIILNEKYSDEATKLEQLYEKNRGEDKYLCADMLTGEDIWLNFNPSDPDSHFKQQKNITLYPNAQTRIPNNAILILRTSPPSKIDLSSPEIKSMIDNLDENSEIIIGRRQDKLCAFCGNKRIELGNVDNTVSEEHLSISKKWNMIFVRDRAKIGASALVEFKKEICMSDTTLAIPTGKNICIKRGTKIIRDRNNNVVKLEGNIDSKNITYEYFYIYDKDGSLSLIEQTILLPQNTIGNGLNLNGLDKFNIEGYDSITLESGSKVIYDAKIKKPICIFSKQSDWNSKTTKIYIEYDGENLKSVNHFYRDGTRTFTEYENGVKILEARYK